MAKRKKGYRRVYDEGTGKTKLGRRKEVDVYRPFTNVGKTLVKDITYKSEDSPRVKYTEREVTRRNKDGSVKSYKNIVRKNGKIVDEATTKKIKYKHGGPHDPPINTSGPRAEEAPVDEDAMNAMMKAKLAYEYMHGNPAAKRMVAPVDNPYDFGDGRTGTHYMSSYDNYAIPEIQDVDGTLEMTGPRDNEAIRFDREEDARYFADENYKRISPMFINAELDEEELHEGVELTDEEVEEYRAGGYVLEELADGGEDDLITYKNNKKLIDGVVDWQSQSDVNISLDYNDQIKARLLTGNYGYNPKTGELVKLSKSQQTKVTDKYALDTKKTLKETAGMSSKEYEIFQDNEKEAAKQNAMSDYTANRKLVSIDKADEWNPSFTIQNESGQNINTQDYAGKQVYMTDAEEAAYKKTRINKNIPIAQQQMNTLFSIPASFTPAGLGIMGMHGTANLALESGPELIKNPSWSNAGSAGLDLLMASPVVIPAGISAVKGVNNLRNVKVPYPKMDLNKLGSYPISKEALPTTVKGTKEYIKNFKPKKTLLIESRKPLRISQYRSKIKYKANELGFDNARIEHGTPIRMQGELDPLFRQRADVNQTVLKPGEKGFTLSESTGSSSSGTGIYFSEPEAWRHSLERGMPNTRTSSYARSPHGEGYLYQSEIKPDAVIVREDGMGKILNKAGYTWGTNMYDIPKEAYDILRKEGVDIVVGGFKKGTINEHVVLNAKAVSKPKLTKKLDATRYQVSYADGSMHGKQKHLPYADRGKVKLVDFSTLEEAEAYVKKMGAKYDKTSDPVQWKSNRRYYNAPDAHRFEIKEVKADSEIFKKGGYIEAELTEKEVAKYKAGGYTLEEMHEGGDIPLHNNPHDPPDNLTFAQKKQAYNDSLTLYNWSKNLKKYELKAESFPKPTAAEKQDNWLYDQRLGARAPGIMRDFMQAANPEVQRAIGNPQYAKAITRLTRLNQEEPGYKANWINVPDEFNKSLSNNWTSYERPTAPVRKPTMEEAYKNVNKETYPTFEDFTFAAEFYKDTGTNPDPQDFPSRRLPPPPLPKYEVEDIEPEIKIDRLPMIKPTLTTNNNLEIIGDYNEPEELERPDYSNYEGVEQVKDRFNLKRKKGHYKDRQRVSAKIAQALTGYDAEKMDAEIEAADKEGRRINFENMGLGAVSNKKFRKKYNEEYDKYEEALKEQEYLNSMPMFFKDGGSMELDLSPEEVTMYANGGYVLEELPSYAPGGANDPGNPLSDWANQQASLWSNLNETDPEGRALATSYFSNIGDNYNLGLIQKGKMPHWSAATVSNAVMANIGATDKETSQILGFNPTASHSGYIRDAFKTSDNPEYKYNRYVAEGVSDSDYGIGDILVKGRSGTKNWKYGDFKKANDSYESHGDIIVDRGKDDKGEYVILAGGNLSDTYKNKKVYLSNLKNNYTVKLTDAKRGERRVGSSQKSNNLGEDVTINEKESSPFANNFDWNAENDQTAEDVNQDPFPISSFDNSSKLVNSNQQALFGGADTLGIGYVPYQYQFPDHLGRPKDDQAYITDEDVSISNSINQNEINKVDDTKTNDVDKTDVILSDDIELTEEQLLTNKAKEIQKLGPLSMFSIDKLKELVDPENASKLTSENPTVKNELNLLKKSGEARDKRLEKGDVWVSYNDPNPYMQTKGWTEAQKSKFWTDPITGEKKKIKSHNPYSIVGPMMDAKSDKQMIKTLGKFYGDGSDKYGEWLTTDEVAKMEHASAKLNAWRDNPNMQNSGRAQEINIMGDSPWNNPLINLAWLRYNPAGFMAWEAGSHVLNRVIESETGGPPLTGSIFSDIKNRPEVYQEAPPKTPGFIESLPDIWDNITNWPVFKQEGGSIPKAKDGRVVSEIWKDMTGTSWSQAKAQGLTDGSYAQNIALRNKLLSGELGEVTPAKSSNSFDYNAYDANVKRLVDKGYSLDDLVKTRMGTMSGLTNRFPDLFTEGSKEEELVEAVAPIETVEEVVTNPVVISNVVSDEDLGKWAMAAKLPAELQAKVDEIKNSPMAKAGDLDYARVVNELGRDALLKNYTPSNVEVTEKETVVEPYVKEDTQNILSLIKNADWASFGNALLDKVSTKTEPLLSALYDASSNASNYFKDRVETLELEALEAENLRRQGYTVEEIDDTSPEETRWNSGTPIDPYSSSTIKDNKPTFENWYLDKVKRYEQTQADEKNTFVPIMKNNIANNFRGQTDDGTGIMYEGPVTSVGQFAQSAGEYTDAAVGLPKKIYEGLSKEIKDVVNKIQKTSILPGSITDDALYKFGTSLVNKDYEALLENKYGQKLALKILDQNENPNKYMNLKLKTLSDQEQQWLRRGLEKAGAIDTPDEVLKLVKEKVVEESPRPQSFMEKVGDVKDSYDRKYKLLSYRNQWDNSEGFVYTTAPVQRDRKSSDTYSDVIGVGHFLLDASMDPTNPYNHGNNKAYIDKAMANDEWIPTFTNVGPHQVRLKYKKPADILETDIVSAPLRQFAFSDINFKSSQTPKGFRSTVKELTTKNGDGTYLLFKSKDGYSRFSGGSVVFIFEDSYGNTITRDFAGSLNSIQKEGVSIQKQYALEPGGLTIGYHDVGSFSAKPKANDNNVLKADQWKGYNNNGYTGGALLIPTSQPLSPKENRSQMKRMFPNTYNR